MVGPRHSSKTSLQIVPSKMTNFSKLINLSNVVDNLASTVSLILNM